jgi:hypothetical protein
MHSGKGNLKGTVRSRVPQTVSAWSRTLFFLATLAGGAGAQAQPMDSTDAPWTPDIVQAIDAYMPDPAFNHGLLGLDHFAGSNSADQVGILTAPLSNGDVVVAGLVPNFGSAGTCSNGTAMCNIGLVRYDAAGVRKAWSNPGSYGNFGNNYVIYPAGDLHKYEYIRDLKVRAGFIDVLVDEIDVVDPGPVLGRQNVRIVTFREDGSYASQFPVFGSTFNASGDTEDFYGAQMVQINSTRMIVAATAYDSIGPYVAVTRLDILGNGAVDQDAGWGSTYGGAGFDQLIRYYAPGSYCGFAAGSCDATAGYAAGQVGFATPTDFYVAASIHIDGDDWDPIAVKISSDTGELKTEFNGTGWSRAVFNESNSTKKDIAAGIYVYQDNVYLAAQVARKCFDGIGLSKLDGATGQYDIAFGASGKIVFGGQGDAPFCFSPPGGDYPFAISATGGRIGVVGYSRHGIVGISNNVDPMLAVVNAVDGSVLDFGFHPVLGADGTRSGDAVFYSVFGGASATSPFTAAGNGRIESAGNTLSYLVGKFIPASGDRIFASNMGGNP